MIKSYYNTNNEIGKQLAKSEKKALSQEEVILSLFNVYKLLSPSFIQSIWINGVDRKVAPPITSVRRAITTLTNKGLLKKTNKMVKGSYDKNEHCWTLAGPRKMEQLNLL
jgi:hypothetical protein